MAPTYTDLIGDPSFPHWGRNIIKTIDLSDIDPVDAANVLEVLAEAAKYEADRTLLVSQAAQAVEVFGDDDLEAFAAGSYPYDHRG